MKSKKMNKYIKAICTFICTDLLVSLVILLILLATTGTVSALVSPVRDMPASVNPGDSFDVTVTWTFDEDNSNSVGLHDEAADASAGMSVTVNNGWCSPAPFIANTPNDYTAEYTWLGPYGIGQLVAAVYNVDVPLDALPGTYTFNGHVIYYVGSTKHTIHIGGDSEIEVTGPGSPEITAFAPASPVSDTEGATRTFSITTNQAVNVSWQINGTEVQTNESVTDASYTNGSAVSGTWDVSAVVENANGADTQTWIWNVIEVGTVPTAESLGVDDASGAPGTFVLVPVNIVNSMNGPVQGIRLGVDYNESVLALTNISTGDLTSTWERLQLGDDGHTMVIATAYTAEALPDWSTGSVLVLNFSVTGAPGDISPMDMFITELSDSAGNIGTAPAQNGIFEVAALGAIDGRISYSCNGTYISDVVVNLTDAGGNVIDTTTTNDTGYYSFADLDPDSYSVNASKPRFWDNSTAVTVTAGVTAHADMSLCLKGDLNANCDIADAGDVVLMLRAAVGNIAGDMRYDLNGNGIIADAGDVVMILRASVGDIELL